MIFIPKPPMFIPVPVSKGPEVKMSPAAVGPELLLIAVGLAVGLVLVILVLDWLLFRR